ncbi:hypothetical protein BSZ39_07990 [Bowdeniella nasicola]|uniref:Uncharacterized protein n=1 Tax=Bowdeniella nasicola TaxID=208480 RepID=A0A1Q5Q1Z6_9ACTO|nr:hypothetical protein BSZ39_07990 [Bowdeniella nasicola]
MVPSDAPTEGYPKPNEISDAHLGLPNSRIQGWKPKEKISPPSWSQEEKAAAARKAAERAFQEKIPTDLPNIELGPYLGFDEGMEKQAECVREKGFPVIVVSKGFAYDPGVPEAQVDALNRAHYECALKFPYDPVFVKEYTEPQMRILYDYWVEAYLPCLESIGRPYEPTPPSKEVFVRQFITREDGFLDWWPPSSLIVGDDRAEAACPQLPPPEDFYGLPPQ